MVQQSLCHLFLYLTTEDKYLLKTSAFSALLWGILLVLSRFG